LKKNLCGSLIDHGALMFGLSSRFPQCSGRRDSCQTLVPRDDAAVEPRSKPINQGLSLLSRRAQRIIHVARHADNDCVYGILRHQLGDAIARINLGDVNRFQRMRQDAELVTHSNSHTTFTRIDSENASSFHLKIPHHKPKLRNNMSSISFDKFGDNLPVTGIVALSQAAVGFGVGLLIADKFEQTARQRTAVALIGAGAATILPFVAGIIANINNRPDSSRRIRKQLDSIRDSTGLSNGHDAF
jgi:hypothetical protein